MAGIPQKRLSTASINSQVTQIDIDAIGIVEHDFSPCSQTTSYINGSHPVLTSYRPSSMASTHTTRPDTARRASSITWQEPSETNVISVPLILKKEVASSRAGRVKPAVQKLASWFKGSPQNLEEIEDAKEDDRKWKRMVREWKRARVEQVDDAARDKKVTVLTNIMRGVSKRIRCT